jgi:hypothetical protein
MEGADISEGEEVRKHNLEFAKHLGDINEVMARMAQTSSVGFIRVVNQNLTSLTISAKAEDRPEQKAAVERLKSLVDGAQTVIGQITSEGDADVANLEIFAMLSTQGAVWKYWRDILYAWAGATTLDFAPLFFMILLSIAYDRQKEEQGGATSEDFRWRVTAREEASDRLTRPPTRPLPNEPRVS